MIPETIRLYDYKLNEKGIKEVKEAKKVFSEFQQNILGRMNPSREAVIVMERLEVASMFMTRAIAQDPDNHTGINTY